MHILLLYVLPIATEILLLCCGAFFAGTETAYTSLSRIKVRQMVKENVANAKKVSLLKSNMERLISTVLIGTNLVTTLASSVATAFSLSAFGASYVSYATALVSILVIIFSEIVPKTYAATYPELVSQKSADIIIVLQKILFPLCWIFDRLTDFLHFIERTFFPARMPLVTEEELKTLIDVGKTEGTLEADEKKMLDRIFEFSDLLCRDIMHPRTLLKFVYVTDTFQEVVSAFALSGHSRLPVCASSSENVIGVLHYKSVLFADSHIAQSKDFVRICMTPVLFVPETLPAVDLLRRFKNQKAHFAVVVNEYGESAGIVTMNDMLREVFGRVTDEYGTVDIAPEKRIKVAGANEFLVPGDMKLEDINDVLKLSLDSEYYDTLGGWLLEHFDELPPGGAVYRYKNMLFIVEDQSARRIQSVRLRITA